MTLCCTFESTVSQEVSLTKEIARCAASETSHMSLTIQPLALYVAEMPTVSQTQLDNLESYLGVDGMAEEMLVHDQPTLAVLDVGEAVARGQPLFSPSLA
jgi:hypothetical protein